MVRRIDTIMRLRHSVPQQRASLKRDLASHGLTKGDVFDLRNRINRLADDERHLALYETWYRDLGDSWAKDDWPHAIRARALAAGALAGYSSTGPGDIEATERFQRAMRKC